MSCFPFLGGLQISRVAEQIEASKRTQLAKGEVGIETPAERTPVPLFSEYAQKVIALLKAQAKNAGTIEFYEKKLKRLLDFPRLLVVPWTTSTERSLMNLSSSRAAHKYVGQESIESV